MIDQSTIEKMVAIWRNGGLVAFPTETVYGLGGDALNSVAVQRIFAAKGRPFSHPLIVHLADIAQLSQWAKAISPEAWHLAKACWPGPLTLILQKQDHIPALVTGGQATIGLRVPSHPVARALLQAFGSGIAAPSANQFTHVSPTTAQDVVEELGDRVDAIVDGGACQLGLESTIVDVSGDIPRLLRPGMLSVEALSAVLGQSIERPTSLAAMIRAPGSHPVHYAPQTPAQMQSTQTLPDVVKRLQQNNQAIAVLTYTASLEIPASPTISRIELPEDPIAYAKMLYHTLRMVDHQPVDVILIEAVPETPAWEAIRDRLSKATAER